MTPDAARMARLVDLAWRLGLERLPLHLRENGETGGLELRLLLLQDYTGQRRTTPAEIREIADPAQVEPRAVTYVDAGRLLGVSGKTVQRLVASGELRSVSILSSPRVPLSEVDAFLERHLGGDAA